MVPSKLLTAKLPWVLAQSVQLTGDSTWSPPASAVTVVDPAALL